MWTIDPEFLKQSFLFERLHSKKVHKGPKLTILAAEKQTKVMLRPAVRV